MASNAGRRRLGRTDEDAAHTLLFVDILGFAALTATFRKRVLRTRRDKHGFTGSATSPIQNQINVFHNIVDRCVWNESLYGSVLAMLFSDCAYIDAGTSLATALLARGIVRECIKRRVPVRMGIGRGTFYPLTFSAENSGSVQISRSRFVGTAVINAHAAEQCGGKGIRIFVHPSAASDLQAFNNRIRLIPLRKPFAPAAYELDYLYEPTPAQAKPSADTLDRQLVAAVKAMNDPTASLHVRRQYAETLNALNKMRKANSRPRVSIRASKSRYIPQF